MGVTELIVVGIDGSEPSRVALRWALADAARRGARVEVVRAVDPRREWPQACGVPPLTLAEVAARWEATGRAMVRSVVAEAGPELADVPVEVVALVGSPGDVLVQQGRRADLLVVGHRGLDTHHRPEAPLGSIGLHCVLNAPCPVTVVRPVRGEGSGAGIAAGGTTARRAGGQPPGEIQFIAPPRTSRRSSDPSTSLVHHATS